MDIATLSANGQITLPKSVRTQLKARPGDQVAFVTNEYGDIVVLRPQVMALLEAQRAFQGAADEAGFTCDEDADAFVAQVRAERKQSLSA
ncbi:MAG: AbrB/MazE/SpoVT family DNA-binding domain-containing protein [Propionibacteriaceae bacterium]|nr:AbrB/MazE/SpoVT family DNA-binding domain-containing protein [Propionibacteriaceae bacterium]